MSDLEQTDQQTANAAASSDPPQGELLSEILAGIYRQEGMTAQGFASLRARLDELAGQLEQLAHAAASDRSDRAPDAMMPDDVAVEDADEAQAEDETLVIESPVDADVPAAHSAEPLEVEQTAPPLAQPVAQPIQPAQQPYISQPVSAPAGGGEFEAIVFADDLAPQDYLANERQQLINDLRSGDPDAMRLVGELLRFRSAPSDQLSPLLKDVGEAWFRWRPDHAASPDALRDALIGWLHAKLESSGLGNRIELVRTGDRYDSKRHNAKERGVEVAAVHGWIVLRDNGKVYTKANVAVT